MRVGQSSLSSSLSLGLGVPGVLGVVGDEDGGGDGVKGVAGRDGVGEAPAVPPPGGVGIGRGEEYVVDDDGGAEGAAGGGVTGRAGGVLGGVAGRAGGVPGPGDMAGRGGMPGLGAGAGRAGAGDEAGRAEGMPDDGGVAGRAAGVLIGGRGAGVVAGRGAGARFAGAVFGAAFLAGAALAVLLRFAVAFLAAFLAVLRPAAFLPRALRAADLRPAALRVVPRAAVLRAALRAPPRDLAADLRFVFLRAPSAAWARFIAAVAAFFIFFKAVAVPALRFLLLDLAMSRPPRCLACTMDQTRRQQNTSSRHEHIFHMTRSCTFAGMVSNFTPCSESGRGPPVAQSMSSTRCTIGISVA
jgi:hypothetical protein